MAESMDSMDAVVAQIPSADLKGPTNSDQPMAQASKEIPSPQPNPSIPSDITRNAHDTPSLPNMRTAQREDATTVVHTGRSLERSSEIIRYRSSSRDRRRGFSSDGTTTTTTDSL